MNTDIRVIHDGVGVYADWLSNDNNNYREVARFHAYTVGKSKPNYPVPAIPLEIDWWPEGMFTISAKGRLFVVDYTPDSYANERCWHEVWRSN